MTIFHTITGVIVAISLVTDDFGNQIHLMDGYRNAYSRAYYWAKT